MLPAHVRWPARVFRYTTSRLDPCLLLAALLLALAVSTTGSMAADGREQALAYIEQGSNAYRMGDLVEATRHWTDAIRLCRLAGDTTTEADALARRGEAFSLLGHPQAAEADMEQALRRAETAGDPVRIAATSGALGNVYFQAHDFRRARPLLERSLALARTAHREPIIAATANNLGNLALADGDIAHAVMFYDASINASSAAGTAALQATALTNKARALLRQGNERIALDALESALHLADEQPPTAGTAYALVAIGRLAYPTTGDQGPGGTARRWLIADEALRRADAIASRLRDPRLSSLTAGYTAELRALQHRPEEAKALAGQAIFFAQRAGATDLLYQWEWLEGRLARTEGHRDTAILFYRRAVTHLQEIRQNIPIDYTDGHSSFREIMGPLYLDLSDMLLRAAAEPGNKVDQTKLLREARDTVERLKTAEVRDYFKDQCLTPLETSGADTVHPATATLYPILFSDRIELLAAVGDEQQRITVPIAEAVITSKTHELRRQLETRGTRDFLGVSQQIYDWLIRPIQPFMQAHNVSTLVVVPDGPLRTIPFAALHDGKAFLITRYSVATELGLTLMDPKPLGRRPISALLSGLSVPAQGYPGLPFVAEELATLRSLGLARTSVVLEDQNFRLIRVKDALKTEPYSVVHIASHAKFSGDPAQTFVVTYDGHLTLQDLENAVKSRDWQRDPLELLTLSACQTAVGDERAALGLAGVAIKAGARSALASLWFIDDEATSRVMTGFYEALQQPGVSKAQALQRAQLELLQDKRFSHPGYWAPFLMIGNWL